MSTLAVWSHVVQSHDVHPYYLVPCYQVSRCPPLRYGLALSSLPMSTPAIWCHVVRSRDVRSRDFSVPPYNISALFYVENALFYVVNFSDVLLRFVDDFDNL